MPPHQLLFLTCCFPLSVVTASRSRRPPPRPLWLHCLTHSLRPSPGPACPLQSLPVTPSPAHRQHAPHCDCSARLLPGLLASDFVTFIFFSNLFFGCAGSSLLHMGFLSPWRAGAALSCGAQASHCSGFSCGARALGTWASVVLRSCVHRFSSSTECEIFPDQGSNPCSTGRQILNHWTTREVPTFLTSKFVFLIFCFRFSSEMFKLKFLSTSQT